MTRVHCLLQVSWGYLVKLLVMLLICAAGMPARAADSMAETAIDKGSRIAIIGAGPSGLTSAHFLREAGFSNVTVFERNAWVGGRVHSVEFDGVSYEAGAVFKINRFETLNYLQSLAKDIEIDDFRLQLSYQVEGQRLSALRYAANRPLKLLVEHFRWQRIARKFEGLELHEYGDVDIDTSMSLQEFGEVNRIPNYCNIIGGMMTGLGYGFADEVPALYFIRSLDNFNRSMRWAVGVGNGKKGTVSVQFVSGYQNLWTQLAKPLDVRLESEVSQVVRSSEGAAIRLLVNDEWHDFDHLIVATSLEDAQAFVPATEAERLLFSRVVSYDYITTFIRSEALAVGQSTLYEKSFVNRQDASVIFLYRVHEPPILTAYQLVPQGLSETEINASLLRDLEPFGITSENIVGFHRWKYFPHISPSPDAAQFWAKLESIQGLNNTFYFGGAQAFDSVGDSAQNAHLSVQRFFVDGIGL